MPSWRLHKKWGKRLLGQDYNEIIDKLIDTGECEIKFETGKSFKAFHDAGRDGTQSSYEMFAEYFNEKFGFNGLIQYALHHILDYAYYLATRKYDIKLIVNKVISKFLKISQNETSDLGKATRIALAFFIENAEEICQDFYNETKNAFKILLDRPRPYVISFYRLELMKRGYFRARRI